MMFKTHLVVSLVVALLVLPHFGLDSSLYLAVFLFASVLPDIDTPTSKIGRKLKLVGWIFAHRGIFHSFLMLFALSIVAWMIAPLIGLAFFLGYATHLLTDMLNHQGIMPLFPMTKPRIRGFIKTNSITENIIFAACLILGFVLLR